MDAPPKIRPFEAVALTVLFAIAICLPLAKVHFLGEPDTSATEKRTLAPWPDFSGSWKLRIKYLPDALSKYYSDHFGFRAMLLKAGSLVNVEWFGVSRQAVIGRDGWLFLKMDPPLFSQSLSAADLAKWKSYLEHRRQWLAARGIKYLFVVPPDKDSIYPEFLPASSEQPPAELPIDQLIRYLKETHSDVDILSLRETMLSAKKTDPQPLYYKKDTHWNTLGAFYGYQAVINHLTPSFPALKAKSRSDYSLVFLKTGGDIAQMAGLPDFTTVNTPFLIPLAPASSSKQDLPYSGYTISPFVTRLENRDDLPRVVMVGDSYMVGLAPYLSETFSRITYFWPPVTATLTQREKIMADDIPKEKPAIFIEERLQRILSNVPDDSAVFGDAEKSAAAAQNP